MGQSDKKKEQPATTAARESTIYTGEAGAKHDRAIAMKGKTPEEGAKVLQKETSALQRRAAWIAQPSKGLHHQRGSRKG